MSFCPALRRARAGSFRSEVPLCLPVPSATLQEPPWSCPPAESVPRLPDPAGSAAVRGRCRPCASPDQAWLPHCSKAVFLLGVLKSQTEMHKHLIHTRTRQTHTHTRNPATVDWQVHLFPSRCLYNVMELLLLKDHEHTHTHARAHTHTHT